MYYHVDHEKHWNLSREAGLYCKQKIPCPHSTGIAPKQDQDETFDWHRMGQANHKKWLWKAYNFGSPLLGCLWQTQATCKSLLNFPDSSRRKRANCIITLSMQCVLGLHCGTGRMRDITVWFWNVFLYCKIKESFQSELQLRVLTRSCYSQKQSPSIQINSSLNMNLLTMHMNSTKLNLRRNNDSLNLIPDISSDSFRENLKPNR